MATGYYFSPAVITSGSVTATQFSTTVTLDSTAATALAGLTNPAVNKRQFRVSGGGHLYTISTVVGTTMTLAEPFIESSVSAQGYQVLRVLYGYPFGVAGTEVTDFLRHNSVRDITNARYFTSVRKTRQEIDRLDPQRNNQSNPYFLASYDADPSSPNRPRWEMWPHSTSALPFLVSYQKRWVDMTVSGNESYPDPIPDQLVMAGALNYAAEWCMANMARYPELEKTRWADYKLTQMQHYKELLKQAMRQDEETFAQNVIIGEYESPPYPVDSAFLQNHDVY